MRITLVTETYPPEVNGVAMTLSRLSRGLAERGHEVLVVRPQQNRDDAGKTSGAVEEMTVSGAGIPRYEGLHFGFPAGRALTRKWKKNRPDVVHVATEGPLGWSAIRAAHRMGLPVVSSFHTNFHSYGKHYGYGALIKVAFAWLRKVHNMTLRTFVPSEDLRGLLEKEGFHNTRILGRGVDTRLFDPARRSKRLRKDWGVDDETPVAIYVGRVAGEKNIPLTLKAFLAMRETLPGMKLVIVGDGPSRERIQAEHPELIFAGLRRGEELAAYYASADIFLFASTTETFGNVVTEAMASGLMVLAYDYAAPQAYIRPGENGMLAPFDDEKAFLAAAKELAQDPSSWTRMRANARETALGLSWDAVIEGYERELLELPEVSKERQKQGTKGTLASRKI